MKIQNLKVYKIKKIKNINQMNNIINNKSGISNALMNMINKKMLT